MLSAVSTRFIGECGCNAAVHKLYARTIITFILRRCCECVLLPPVMQAAGACAYACVLKHSYLLLAGRVLHGVSGSLVAAAATAPAAVAAASSCSGMTRLPSAAASSAHR